MTAAVWWAIAPIGVALVVDLVWMGLALGAVLRKVGQSGAIAFVPVMRWVAAAQAARMSRVAVGLARGVAAIGLVAMLGGLVWVLQEADAAPPAARLTLLVGGLTYAVGTLVGWVLWIYGSGTIQLRLKAASGLSWVAALSPHIWASILGWGRYSMAGRTDEAARRAAEAQQGPVRSQAVAASSFALRSEDEPHAPVASRGPAEEPSPPLSPYAPGATPVASTPEPAPQSAPVEHATDGPPVTPLAATPFAPVTPPAPDESPAETSVETPAQEARGTLPPGWTATPPERVSPVTPAASTPPPTDMRALSAPSADDVPTLSAPTLDAASAAIPLVAAAVTPSAPSGASAPSVQTAPSTPSAPAVPSAPSAPSRAPSAPSAPTPTPVEAPTDTLAVSPYLAATRDSAAEEPKAPVAEPAPTPEQEQAPTPGPAPVAEIPVAPAVSPYLAPAPTGEAEPQWLVEARRQAQQQAPAPSVPTPEPEAETAAVPTLLPPLPEPEPEVSEAGEQATASAVPDDDADDRTVLAARRRATWNLTVGPDRYELPDRPVVIGRATPGGGADRIGIVDITRTISKVHARLEPRGDRWYVTDMGSTNGTVVRGPGGAEIEASTTEAIEVTGTLLLGDLEVNLTREGDA